MIDIHSHILPGVDDGAQSMEEACELLDQYQQYGFTSVVCTPHIANPAVDTRIAAIREVYQAVKQEAAKRDISLYLGSELYVTEPRPQPAIPMFKKFQLIEFNTQIKPAFLTETVYHFTLLGLEVIIAHIDRYRWFSPEDSMILRLREMGVFFQMNIEAASTSWGRRMIERDLVDFLATDWHGTQRGELPLQAFGNYPRILERMETILLGYERFP